MKQYKSYLYVILAATFWGLTGLFIRNLTAAGFTSPQTSAIRVVVALVGMFFVILFKDKKLFKIKLKDIWCFLGTGIVGLVVFNLFYFQAMQYTTISVAAVLLYTAPSFVVVFSAFLFKEKLTLPKILAMVIMLIGCVFVTGLVRGVENISVVGVLCGLGAAVAYALYSIFGRFALNKGYSPYTIAFYTFLVASVAALPFAQLPQMLPLFTPSSIVWAVIFGVVSCLLPYILYTNALVNIETGKASMLATVEPVVATLVSVCFGEEFTIFTAIGIGLIFGGMFVMNGKLSFANKITKRRL